MAKGMRGNLKISWTPSNMGGFEARGILTVDAPGSKPWAYELNLRDIEVGLDDEGLINDFSANFIVDQHGPTSEMRP